MRYGIIADIHGNFQALEATLGTLSKEKIDKYLCLGDIVGYGASPEECIARIKELNPGIVAGNHDWASVGLFDISYFNPEARDTLLWTKKNLKDEDRQYLKELKLIHKQDDLTLVHGSVVRPEEFKYIRDVSSAERAFSLLETRICFVGHTHRPIVFIQKDKDCIVSSKEKLHIEPKQCYIVNAGSVGQPRDGNPKGRYVVYDTDKEELETKSVSYDIKTAQEKIIKAGLPRMLAERLRFGK